MEFTIDNDSWQFWDFYDQDNNYGTYVTDPFYYESSERKGFEKEVFIKIKFPKNFLLKESLFPTPESFELYMKYEEVFEKLLIQNKVDCKKVHFSIYYGARRLLYQVNDNELFKECLIALESKMQPFEFEVIENNSWTIFPEFLPNKYDRQQIANRDLIRILAEKGSNLKKEHCINHTFSGKKRNLKKIEKELSTMNGKTISIEKNLLEISFNEILDEDTITEMTYICIDFAKEFNCNYDGWSSSLIE